MKKYPQSICWTDREIHSKSRMSAFDELVTIIGIGRDPTEQPPIHYECRRCGKTLSERDTDCPVCGSTDVAEIPL